MSYKAIEVNNITKLFLSSDGSKFTALDKISFSVEEGQIVVLSGENGSGKSVLMHIISGLEKPTKGTVTTKSKVGLVFQDADSQILGETPIEDICFGLANIGIKGKEAEEKASKVLKEVKLYEKRNSPSHFLSGGEKRRLAIAAILALGFDTIIMDEPYSNLDYAGVKEVNALVAQLHKGGKTLLILTHEIEKCLGLADRFMVLKAGHLLFDGTAQEGLKELVQHPDWGIRNPLSAYNSLEALVWS
jgi:biotin transport system ATP-binding protein